VAVAEPVTTYPILNVISPTPRAFTFPMDVHTPSPSPSNSPFDPDLRTLTFSTPPPHKTHTPSSSITSISSLSLTSNTTSSLSADVPATPPSSHRRRRSTVSDISERRPKKGDEDYIKRPENAFILFRRKCCEDRNLAQGAGDAGDGDGSAPTKKQRQADLSKTISQQWKCLSPEERQYWEDLAKDKKKEHEALYPNYVYRPQRVKGKKAAANGKGKARGPEEPETDSEGLSFVMPVPAVQQRLGRRAISAPTPPPAYQQTIHIPMVYMPSTPASPSMVPISIPRTCSPTQIPTQLSSTGLGYDFVPPNASFAPAFNNPPQGWNPDSTGCGDTYVTVFDMPQLDPLTIPPCAPAPSEALFKTTSPCSYTSSGRSSPHMSPYTPAALEALHVPIDAWQAQTSLSVPELESPMPVSLGYQPYSWANAPDLWVNGSAPMFNDHFDITMIPPISIEVPKFDGMTRGVDELCTSDFLSAQTGEQDGDTYGPVFTFNDANEIQLVDSF